LVTKSHTAERVAEYFLWLSREDPITPMQLLKMVYISHGWMLGLHSRPLFAEQVEAWQYGPVVASVYHRYKKFGSKFITDYPQHEPIEFDSRERKVMEQVWNAYHAYTGVQLSALTHQKGSPWDLTRRTIHGSLGVISNDLIEDHYRRLSHRTPQVVSTASA
jgi:uncharacterized phage-associated protein